MFRLTLFQTKIWRRQFCLQLTAATQFFIIIQHAFAITAVRVINAATTAIVVTIVTVKAKINRKF